MSTRQLSLICLSFILSIHTVFAQIDFTADGWDEIPEEEFAADSPKIDPNAHVEFLYRKLDINDDRPSTNYRYHNRLKVFTEAGVKELNRIDILYVTGFRVSGLKARVIRPNKEIILLENDDFYKREIYEEGSFKSYAMSFALPKLEPGCIVEYRWTLTKRYFLKGLNTMLCADWPTWQYDISIRYYRGLASRVNVYNSSQKIQKEKSRYVLSMKDLPAIAKSSYLPPRKEFEPWLYLGYSTSLDQLTPEDYWAYRGGFIESVNDSYTRPRQSNVKKLAQELFSELKTPQQKLRRAYEYVTTEIINTTFDTTHFTEQELEDLKQNQTPGQIVKRGYGTRMEINGLFASLANRAGYQAYLCQVENRNDHNFRMYQVGSFSLSEWIVGLRIGKTWRFFDPGSPYLPFERLNPENNSSRVIYADEKYYYFQETPEIAADQNTIKRIGALELSTDGNLSGRVEITYSGYEATWRRRVFNAMTEEEIKTYIEDEIWRSRLSASSVSAIEIQELKSSEEPLQVSYHIKVQNYADFAGNRIILNPSVFQKNTPLTLTEPDRSYGVFFSSPWMQNDHITIQLPESFKPEYERPTNLQYEGSIIRRESLVLYDPKTHRLTFTRDATLSDSLLLQKINAYGTWTRPYALNYLPSKIEFDTLHRMDTEVISLIKNP